MRRFFAHSHRTLARTQQQRNYSAQNSSSSDPLANGTSGAYVEEMYAAWQRDPSSVHASWRAYFRSLSNPSAMNSLLSSLQTISSSNFISSSAASSGNVASSALPTFSAHSSASANGLASIQDHLKVQLLVRAYQVRGHLRSNLDPLGIMQPDRDFCPAPELEPSFYGFTQGDLNGLRFHLGSGLLPEFQAAQPVMTLGEIINQLKQTYCSNIGYEYTHIPDRIQCNWLRARIEVPQPYAFTREQKLVILDRLLWSELFEKFVALKYPSEKRFGLEGCESLIPGLKALIDRSVELGVEKVVMGMPHRGRLNVLSNVVRKPNQSIFSEFASGVGAAEADLNYTGDVKYHLGMTYERPTPSGRRVELSLVANPSHLEAVDPVVEGKVRALQRTAANPKSIMPLLMHGDAAFAGQGVVYETLGMSMLPSYRTGGTVHVIVNNQVGFTTDPRFARSTPYCSDVAKSIAAPILHVNADDPEAVVHACQLAADWRQEFGSDVVVDLVGYRRHGHNEIDQPAFTQPRMYARIATQPSVLELYSQKLLQEGTLTAELYNEMKDRVWGLLEESYTASKDYRPQPFEWQTSKWPGMKGPKEVVSSILPAKPTGITPGAVQKVAQCFTAWPADFKPHPGVQRIMEARKKSLLSPSEAEGVDMSTAEALAFGSLLQEGVHVRLGGQDVERGTFSQRHAVLHNQNAQLETQFLPLSLLCQRKGKQLHNYLVS